MIMPRFRSTAAFLPRLRATSPTIERATFVIFALGAHRFGAYVEAVERVLRVSPSAGASATVLHAGVIVPVMSLAESLEVTARRSNASRILVIVAGSRWVAVEVDVVYEVVAIDAATVQPLVSDGSRTYLPTGVRGVFRRADHDVLVLDVARMVETASKRVRTQTIQEGGETYA